MAADVVLVLHVAFVAFVLCGLGSVWLGHAAGWRWVDDGRFRALHAAAIALVVAEAWLGVACPLTVIEGRLRAGSGSAGALRVDESFIAHWLSRLLYWEAPSWVFTTAYSLFGLAIAATWWRFPPRRH